MRVVAKYDQTLLMIKMCLVRCSLLSQLPALHEVHVDMNGTNALSGGSARLAMNTYKIGSCCCDTCCILENSKYYRNIVVSHSNFFQQGLRCAIVCMAFWNYFNGAKMILKKIKVLHPIEQL